MDIRSVNDAPGHHVGSFLCRPLLHTITPQPRDHPVPTVVDADGAVKHKPANGCTMSGLRLKEEDRVRTAGDTRGALGRRCRRSASQLVTSATRPLAAVPCDNPAVFRRCQLRWDRGGSESRPTTIVPARRCCTMGRWWQSLIPRGEMNLFAGSPCGFKLQLGAGMHRTVGPNLLAPALSVRPGVLASNQLAGPGGALHSPVAIPPLIRMSQQPRHATEDSCGRRGPGGPPRP